MRVLQLLELVGADSLPARHARSRAKSVLHLAPKLLEAHADLAQEFGSNGACCETCPEGQVTTTLSFFFPALPPDVVRACGAKSPGTKQTTHAKRAKPLPRSNCFCRLCGPRHLPVREVRHAQDALCFSGVDVPPPRQFRNALTHSSECVLICHSAYTTAKSAFTAYTESVTESVRRPTKNCVLLEISLRFFQEAFVDLEEVS